MGYKKNYSDNLPILNKYEDFIQELADLCKKYELGFFGDEDGDINFYKLENNFEVLSCIKYHDEGRFLTGFYNMNKEEAYFITSDSEGE